MIAVLEKKDSEGKVVFSCTADIAVEAAYLMSMAEYYAFERRNEHDVGEILGEYAAGRISQDEAIEQMEECCDAPIFANPGVGPNSARV